MGAEVFCILCPGIPALGTGQNGAEGMTLDAKTLETAVEIFTAKLGPCFHSVGSIDAKLIAAFKETLDDADLVPRGQHLTDDMNDIVAAGLEIERLTNQRDEARKEAETQGRQLAALRDILEALARDGWLDAITGEQLECADAALYDTAAAAAQYRLVDDEHVVMPVEPTNRILHYLYGPFLSSSSHQSRIDAYKSAMQLAPAKPEPEDAG